MADEKAIKELVTRIMQIRKEKGSIDAGDIDELLMAVGRVLTEEKEIHTELKAIADKIRKAKEEASELRQDGGQIKDANLELDEVIKATEAASNRIMDAAEKIQAAAGGNTEIIAQVTDIFEACTFQDITGQRIRKVLGLLGELEQGFGRLLEIASMHGSSVGSAPKSNRPKTQAEKDKELLNGPQATKDKPSQDDIDKLFASL